MTGNLGFSREHAWQLLTEWTQSESLRKHALAVEACVVDYGEREADRLALEGDARSAFVNLYSTTALLHDFDYERHPTPEEHPFVGVRELERLGWPEEMRTAILGHALYSGVPRETHLAKVSLCLRRVGRLPDGVRAGQADEIHRRRGSRQREEEDEGQSIRPRRPSRGHRSGRSRARRRPRRPHRVLH